MFSKTMTMKIRIGKFSKSIRTSAKVFNSEVASVSKKEDYYKNFWVQDDSKPAGWDEALPFEAIPGPKPIPILGNMWRFFPYVGEYYNVPLQKQQRMFHETFGNVVILKGIIGRKPIVMLFDVNDMETFLRNAGPFPIRKGMESFIYYRTKMRKDIFQGVGGVLTVQGEDWFKFRSQVNPIMMQPRTAQQYVGSMDLIANELIKNMEHFSAQAENNEMPENFLSELYKWSLESIGVIALNKHLGCLNLNMDEESEPRQFVSHVVEMFQLMYKLDILPPVWKLVSTPTWRRYVEVLDFLTTTAMKYIDESLAEGVKENHELSVLQRLVNIDRKVAIAMVIDMLIAGVDTTGRVLGAALYFMARHPEKQKCLREEILRNLPNKNTPITKETLNNSPYLRAVIKETIRMAPIGVATLRTTVKDLVLGGYRIPRDTEVMSGHIVSSFSEQFKDADKFVPERYLRSADDEYSYKNAHPFASLPFGFGARSCVGKRFANLELEVGLTKILRNFELSWHHEDMKFSGNFLYGIASPLKLKVQPLKD